MVQIQYFHDIEAGFKAKLTLHNQLDSQTSIFEIQQIFGLIHFLFGFQSCKSDVLVLYF